MPKSPIYVIYVRRIDADGTQRVQCCVPRIQAHVNMPKSAHDRVFPHGTMAFGID